jgi:fido (protein-threonine AMPylation protein)
VLGSILQNKGKEPGFYFFFRIIEMALERSIVNSLGLIWLAKQKNDPKKYTFWLRLHKKLFENVWSWAGKIRTHELDNPDFCHPRDIWSQMYHLEQDLNAWITYNSFPNDYIAARFHERIETIHPYKSAIIRICQNPLGEYNLAAIQLWVF